MQRVPCSSSLCFFFSLRNVLLCSFSCTNQIVSQYPESEQVGEYTDTAYGYPNQTNDQERERTEESYNTENISEQIPPFSGSMTQASPSLYAFLPSGWGTPSRASPFGNVTSNSYKGPSIQPSLQEGPSSQRRSLNPNSSISPNNINKMPSPRRERTSGDIEDLPSSQIAEMTPYPVHTRAWQESAIEDDEYDSEEEEKKQAEVNLTCSTLSLLLLFQLIPFFRLERN